MKIFVSPNIQHLLTLGGAKPTILDTVVVQLSTDFIIKIRHLKNVHYSWVPARFKYRRAKEPQFVASFPPHSFHIFH